MRETYELIESKWANPGPFEIPFVLLRSKNELMIEGTLIPILTSSVHYFSKFQMTCETTEGEIYIAPWSDKMRVFYEQYVSCPFEDTLPIRLKDWHEEIYDVHFPWTCMVCGEDQTPEDPVVCGYQKFSSVLGKVWQEIDETCAACSLNGRAKHFSYPLLAKQR